MATEVWQDAKTGKWHAVNQDGITVGPFGTREEAELLRPNVTGAQRSSRLYN